MKLALKTRRDPVEASVTTSPHGKPPPHGMLKALAEPQRIAILRLVHDRELPAGDIAEHFTTKRQTTSQHLRVLTNAGLLAIRRDGTRRLYRARKEAFAELSDFLSLFWDDRLTLLRDQVEADKRKRRDKR